MGRSSGSFTRPSSRFKPHPLVLVICEDSKSGKQYLEDAKHFYRVEVKVEVSHCGKTDPKGIVEAGISRQNQFNHVFCVIDRDNHENFDEALALAHKSAKVCVIASYPCFEFWYLLHFRKTRKAYSSVGERSAGARLVSDLKKIPEFADYTKGNMEGIFSMLLGKPFEFARKTAPQVYAEALAEDEMNPSTALHKLIDFFEYLSEPQKIQK